MKQLLELKGATKRFGSLVVLDSLDLKLPNSGVVAILGTSGSGKTTMLRIIAGLEKLDSGQLIKPPEVRVSMVFQEDRLIPGLSAAENILAVLPPHNPDNTAKTTKILDACGLSLAAHKLPGQLSGGMQRRVAIGRALAFGGEILLLDEPFKGLDPSTREDVIRIVLSARQGLTMLVTHSVEEAERCADIILHFDGPPLQKTEK